MTKIIIKHHGHSHVYAITWFTEFGSCITLESSSELISIRSITATSDFPFSLRPPTSPHPRAPSRCMMHMCAKVCTASNRSIRSVETHSGTDISRVNEYDVPGLCANLQAHWAILQWSKTVAMWWGSESRKFIDNSDFRSFLISRNEHKLSTFKQGKSTTRFRILFAMCQHRCLGKHLYHLLHIQEWLKW